LLVFCSGLAKTAPLLVDKIQKNTVNEVRTTITNSTRDYTLTLRRESSLQGGIWEQPPSQTINPRAENGTAFALPRARSVSIIKSLAYDVSYEGGKVGVCYFSVQNYLNDKPIEYDTKCEMDRRVPYPVTTMKRARSADKVDTIEFLVTN
jgi:hypothetical protein